MRLLGVLLAAAVVVGAAAATPNVKGPAALLTYTGSPHADPEGGQYLACVARADGTHRVRIVTGSYSASTPSWNRAGTRVAFTGWNLPSAFGSVDGVDIVVADARGKLLANMTAGFSPTNFNPKWSPDGRWIAFISDVLNLTVVPADGSQPPHVIDVPDFSGSFDWAGDSERLLAATYDGIVSIGIDGTGLTPVLGDGATDPAVSPNGKKLLFVKGDQNFDLYVANVDGTGVRRLTKTARDETSPSWSPDAKWIAYEQNVYLTLVNPHERIVVARSNGTEAHVVITGKRYDPFFPSWRRGTSLPKATRGSC
jgi:Tol biopolymer transport system component